jgi:uncharacterized protein YfaS (alpha-2-macroglobulin family)
MRATRADTRHPLPGSRLRSEREIALAARTYRELLNVLATTRSRRRAPRTEPENRKGFDAPMTNPRRLAPPAAHALLVLLVAAVSCFPGAKAPSVTPTRTLDLEREAGERPPAKFGVVFASPQGETEDASEVTVVFNRPMRPLELAGEESNPPATIVRATGGGKTEPVPGAFRWLGTHALIFAPASPLLRASEYTVNVPAGTRAEDGSSLDEPYTFTFQTRRPTLVRTDPFEGATRLVPQQTFTLRFDQPMDPREVERAVSIQVESDGKSKRIPFAASWGKPEREEPPAPPNEADPKSRIVLRPKQPLPLASTVRLVLSSSLRGLEGPLPLGREQKIAMRTYGPLAVVRHECWRGTPNRKCDANGSIQLELSNPVSLKDVRARLRIEPPVPMRWGSLTSEESRTDFVSIPAELKPSRTYRIVLGAGLKDEFGQVLAKDEIINVETDELWPGAAIGLEGSVFESEAKRLDKAREIPITSVNTDEYELATGALDEVQLAGLAQRTAGGRRDDFGTLASLAKVETVRPSAPKNVESIRRVNLESILAKSGGRGVALLALRYRGANRRAEADTRIVSVTDLGVSAKLSRNGGAVWVTRLSSAQPVPSATVTIRRGAKVLFTGQTDVRGLVAIPEEQFRAVTEDGSVDQESILVVRSGQDWTYRRVAEFLSPWRYGAPLSLSGSASTLGLLFSDRGVYRPGETVRVKGIFRKPTPKGTATPAGSDVTLEVYDGHGEKIHEARAKLDAFGEFSTDVKVPATAHLGVAELRAELDPGKAKARTGAADDDNMEEDYGAWGRRVGATFTLAAYRASEFKVTVEADKPSYVRGDKASFSTRGDYLFGAPMKDGRVRYTASRGWGYFEPPGSEGLVTNDESYRQDLVDTDLRAGEIQSGEGVLDAKGALAVPLALSMPNQRGTEVVTFESEVEDVSRQTIASRASAIVHPGEFYLGLKAADAYFVAKGTKLEPTVVAIEPKGPRRSGVRVKLELVRRTWSTVVEADGEGRHYESKVVDTVAASCSVTTADKAVGCPLTVPDAGYFIVRATAADKRGNALAASSSLYATGDSENVNWLVSDATQVEIVADKKSYEVGETARLLVKSPFREANALVTVERAGVLEKRQVALRGATPTIDVKITDEMRPNAFVSVHLVRGRTQTPPAKGADIGAPAFRLGYANLLVNPEARRLKVSITPNKTELRPGEEIDVALAVTDRQGKPVRSQITFYAVDEGVLMLTGYKTPDPIPAFTGPRPLSVFTIESREDLAKIVVRHLGEPGVDKGDEGGGGGAMRADFRATAFFEPKLVTGPDGKQRVRFKLPDNLTTYRLMAVASAEDDRFGFGETQVVASRSLMARPALPRFLRAGDTIDAGVVVSTKGLPESRVDVVAEAEGVELRGEARRTITVPSGGSVEVRFAMTAPRAGQAKLRFRVTRGAETDAVEVTRKVDVPTSLEAVALAGQTDDAQGERLGELGAIRTDVGGLEVKLASTALVGIGDGAEQLVRYPYGCTEQLVGRLVPMLPLRSLARDFNVPLPGNVDAVVSETLAKILKAQRDDGSFAYWSDSPWGNPWLTAYVAWALDIAAKQGQPLPKGALEQATGYLRGYVQRGESSQLGQATRAFIVDVLAMAGKPDFGATTTLFERRKELPLFARALLAHAMATSKMDAKLTAELVRELETHVVLSTAGATITENVNDAYAPLLDSTGRTTAMVLRALLAFDPKHPMGARLARGLVAMRKGGEWRSTQEAAWALLALDDYRRAQEAVAPDFEARAFLGDTLLASAPFRGRSAVEKATRVDAAKLLAGGGKGGDTLAFQAVGKGTLHYQARLRYARRDLPTSPLDRGFSVQRIVRSVRPEALRDALATLPRGTAASAAGGDLVLVDLLVVAPNPRDYVVIDDPLPAGLEAIDAQLATSTQRYDVVAAGGLGDAMDEEESDDDARAAGRAKNFAFYHREVHDDRVLTFVEHMPAGFYHYRYLARATTFGRFIVPPAKVECMYEPEIFGRTAASTFEVVPSK